MERVAFLVEETGQRVSCLLNPESVQLRRQSGVRPRESAGGLLSGANLLDDPLLLTGGGWTELTLNLLFDVTLDGSSIRSADVRDLTGPLWGLAENTALSGGRGRPPQVRFFWGKSWNIPGVIAAIAERLEYFTADGAPRRSWLRLRLLRAASEVATTRRSGMHPGGSVGDWPQQGAQPASPDGIQVHEVSGAQGEGPTDRLDTLAYRYYGDASLWRRLAQFNGLDSPFRLAPGLQLEIPSFIETETE
ncbi:MAG TPA: hypothetical protein ENN42_09860 [Thioalkalivibrio sp.]|nr:hypothetical protein [Thioalkalivibrio sp.]